MHFYVLRGERKSGPFAVGSATDCVVRGELRATDLVSLDGEHWVLAKRIKQFAEALECAPVDEFDDLAQTTLQDPTPAPPQPPAPSTTPAPWDASAPPRPAPAKRSGRVGLWIAAGGALLVVLLACTFGGAVLMFSRASHRAAWNAPSAPAPSAPAPTPAPAPAPPTSTLRRADIWGCWRAASGEWTECFRQDGSYSYAQGGPLHAGRWSWLPADSISIRRPGRAEAIWAVVSVDATHLALHRGGVTFDYLRNTGAGAGSARAHTRTMLGCWTILGKPRVSECYNINHRWARGRDGNIGLLGTWRQIGTTQLVVTFGGSRGLFQLTWLSSDRVIVSNNAGTETFLRAE